MPIIRPISDLQTKLGQLRRLTYDSDEPIFLTTKGVGDLVIMPIRHYEALQRRLNLYSKLSESELSRANGEKGKPYRHVMLQMRKRLSNFKNG